MGQAGVRRGDEFTWTVSDWRAPWDILREMPGENRLGISQVGGGIEQSLSEFLPEHHSPNSHLSVLSACTQPQSSPCSPAHRAG